MTRNEKNPALGVVAIGRNEGERLRRCLESLRKQCEIVLYVDSGSQDESVRIAREQGVEVVDLYISIPFMAARALNVGLKRLRELRPGIEFVQFVDSGCGVLPDWITAALRAMLDRPTLAVVCGRLRERYREATIYNRLCIIEWNTPVGDVEACGGNALLRVAALERVGGYNLSLIAGEEPDLCRRMRSFGHVVLRIDTDMALFDAPMTRLDQWWRRMIRNGYGAADSIARNGTTTREVDRRYVRGVVIWVMVLPGLNLLGFSFAAQRGSTTMALSVAGIALSLVLGKTLSISAKRDSPGENAADASQYAVFCMAAKLPRALGIVRYLRDRLSRRTPRHVEFK